MLVVIAATAAGGYERGDVLGIYPDGTFLGRRVTAGNGFAVVRCDPDVRRRDDLLSPWLKTFDIEEALALRLDRPPTRGEVEAGRLEVGGDSMTLEVSPRRRRLDLDALDRATRDRLLTGETAELTVAALDAATLDRDRETEPTLAEVARG